MYQLRNTNRRYSIKIQITSYIMSKTEMWHLKGGATALLGDVLIFPMVLTYGKPTVLKMTFQTFGMERLAASILP